MVKLVLVASLLLAGCMDPERPLLSGGKISGRYALICLEGHAYYSVTSTQSHDWMNIESIAPKLGDDGRPVKCQTR